MLSAQNLNDQTIAGIDTRVIAMESKVNQVFADILESKDFSQSSFADNQASERHYTMIAQLLDNTPKAARDDLKQGILESYRLRMIEATGDGLQISGVGVGIVDIAGYLPTPVIGLNLERTSTTWNQVDTVTAQDPSDEVIPAVNHTIDGGLDNATQ